MSDAFAREVTELDANNGLKKNARREVAEALSRSVADTDTLFASTQGLHWNVQGPLFYSVHKMTEERYPDMREAVEKAEGLNDVKTADLLTERLGVHEDNAWMLRATIAD